MKIKHLFLLGMTLLTASLPAFAQAPATLAEAEKLVRGLNYQRGEIKLAADLATINVPPQFKFLSPSDAAFVLEQLWNNPHSSDQLGMLLPADKSPLDEDCWAVTIAFVEDGYVDDEEASKIDYDDLLKDMKKGVRQASKERVKEGYPSIELIGWAAPPHYDATTHKLHWAKELKFGGESLNTLNYNIRMLGRRGVLELNVIAGMNQLATVQNETPRILEMVNFNEGHRYADFDPKSDRVASYGIAALVAGGIASKLGFFKMIWVAILALKKFAIIGVLALGALLKKLFFGRKNNPSV